MCTKFARCSLFLQCVQCLPGVQFFEMCTMFARCIIFLQYFYNVCQVYNVGPVPESETNEKELVLTVTRIANHPGYHSGQDEEETKSYTDGPYRGHDISVYHVNDDKLRLEEGKLWPACLPRLEFKDSDPAFFAGWKDQEPIHKLASDVKVSSITQNDYFPRRVQVKNVSCSDPSWMDSNTFYPARTLCFKDPSEGSCFQHGNSGSSVMTYFGEGNGGNGAYAFTGPLSMHKGCDKASFLNAHLTSIFLRVIDNN